jgi:hypothetical protein
MPDPHTNPQKESTMSFVTLMNSPGGRLARILAGLAFIVIGLAVIGGTGGLILAVVGLVPLGAGLGDVCLFGPLFGTDLRGTAK